MLADQKRGGVLPVVEPIAPIAPLGSVEFGVIVLESGVDVFGAVVERLRERERERDERVVLVDGVLRVESVVVVDDVLGDD